MSPHVSLHILIIITYHGSMKFYLVLVLCSERSVFACRFDWGFWNEGLLLSYKMLLSHSNKQPTSRIKNSLHHCKESWMKDGRKLWLESSFFPWPYRPFPEVHRLIWGYWRLPSQDLYIDPMQHNLLLCKFCSAFDMEHMFYGQLYTFYESVLVLIK